MSRRKGKGGNLPANRPRPVDGEVIDLKSPETKDRRLLLALRSHSGPIPSADEYRGYEMVHPGSAERIMKMAEQNQQHRIDMDRKEATRLGELQTNVIDDRKAARSERRIGQFLGVGLGLALIGLAVYMVNRGEAAVAGTMLGVVLVGMIVAMMTGTLLPSPKQASESSKPSGTKPKKK